MTSGPCIQKRCEPTTKKVTTMEFKQFKKLQQEHISKIIKNQTHVFTTDVDKDVLWNLYLDSFPPGTNEIFRERREYDCSCCKQFVRAFGNVVVINENKVITIWDFDTRSPKYQPVVDALSEYVRSKPANDVFVTKESKFGTDSNAELLDDGAVRTWEHFFFRLPPNLVTRSSKSEASIMGEFRDVKNVFKRSLEEISRDSIETILDLISQKSLYKGEEWEGVLKKFLTLHKEYSKISKSYKNNYCWAKSIEVGASIGKIKNHSIGVLLTDISEGMDLDQAVKRYEAIVAPTNYKRPKAIFTKKMIEDAEKALAELGLLDSLGRRFATIDDITVNNILFANKDSMKRMKGSVFAELKDEVAVNPKKFDKVDEVSIETFINDILPRCTKVEALFDNSHVGNLVSLIAPEDMNSKTMFKWNNNFSWAYNGNITDSMKERVKAAGGKVDGVFRFSIQWNENNDNQNDLDAHVVEPKSRNHIYYGVRGFRHPSTGMLDVDIINPGNKIAVENISYLSLDKMPEGIYHFYVNCYNNRSGRNGFRAEIEFNGQIFSYDYPKNMRTNENVTVAKVEVNRKTGFKIIESMPSSVSSREVWGLKTNQFHPVAVLMYSPNYWDLQTGIGNRHYFFMLNKCINGDAPNGFFNEFLKEDLNKHKRVFEALGSKMKVEASENQLSGLGFSSTQRNSLVVKVEGYVARMLKIIF